MERGGTRLGGGFGACHAASVKLAIKRMRHLVTEKLRSSLSSSSTATGAIKMEI